MKIYVDTSRLSVREINKNLAKKMIITHHYSHKWSSCRYALGLFYDTGNEHSFFDETEEKLIGVAIYGYPVGRLAAGSISDYLKPDEVLELTRLFIFDDYGSNIESYFLSKTFKWLKQNDKTIKGLVSYSDPEQNHQGTIYQATNWIYQGNSIRLMKNYGIKLSKDGDWMHSRTVSATYGSHNVEHLKKKIGHTFWRKEEPEKHRYVYLLCNKKDKKKIMDTIKHPPLPYPKDTEYKENIEEIIVDERL
jgi:hypothetical protein